MPIIQDHINVIKNKGILAKMKQDMPEDTYNLVATNHNQTVSDCSNNVSKYIIGFFVLAFGLSMLFNAGKTTGSNEVKAALADTPLTEEVTNKVNNKLVPKEACDLNNISTCKNKNKF